MCVQNYQTEHKVVRSRPRSRLQGWGARQSSKRGRGPWQRNTGKGRRRRHERLEFDSIQSLLLPARHLDLHLDSDPARPASLPDLDPCFPPQAWATTLPSGPHPGVRYPGTPSPAPVPVPGIVPVPVLSSEQGTREQGAGKEQVRASKQAETWLSLLPLSHAPTPRAREDIEMSETCNRTPPYSM